MTLRAIGRVVLAVSVAATAASGAALADTKPAGVLAVFHDCGASAVGDPTLLRTDYRPSIDDPRHLGRQTVDYVSLVPQCERTTDSGAYVPAGLRVDLFGPCGKPVPCPIGTTVLTTGVDGETFTGTLHDEIGFRVLNLGTNRTDALVLRVKTKLPGSNYGPTADYLLLAHEGGLAPVGALTASPVGCALEAADGALLPAAIQQ